MSSTRNLCLLAAPVLALVLAGAASAAPVTYQADPMHTFPSFEADHMGISVWRGKMNRSSGTVVYDKATGAGSVDLKIDLDGIDFGLEALNKWARGSDFFDVAKNPVATYKGNFAGILNGTPTLVKGELSLHGVTQPVVLEIKSLKCIPHPMLKCDYCGADAKGSFDRSAFGLDAGKDWGFKMNVDLRIQIEALAQE